MPRRAFTLIELLVVVAIIAILAAILFPVFAQAKLAAKKTVCLSNQKTICTALQLYTGDYDGFFPRTQETLGTDEPGYISYQSEHYYEKSLDPYIKNGVGGVNGKGERTGRAGIWYDPADPLKDLPAMWGSFANNGLVTGVTLNESGITNPANTIVNLQRTADWAAFIGIAPPNPLPISNPNDDFWASDWWDICINPWFKGLSSADTVNPYHWTHGKATPPSTLGRLDYTGPVDAVRTSPGTRAWTAGPTGTTTRRSPC